jgi:hypothetical protein
MYKEILHGMGGSIIASRKEKCGVIFIRNISAFFKLARGRWRLYRTFCLINLYERYYFGIIRFIWDNIKIKLRDPCKYEYMNSLRIRVRD